MTVKIMQYKAGRNTCRGKKGIMEEYTNQEIDTEYLQMLPKDSLQTVISWTLRDLETWANNEQATEKVQGFSAMLLEAIRYQMQKQIDILNKQEEQ
tara:strand:+ start:244 stop:531 length:288 start_codon:yes stop_codon:yes gene_type:complete